MKKMNHYSLENIKGGDGWGCFFTVSALVSVSVAAVLAPPAGAALAATIVSSGVTFGGFVYGMAQGACE